MMPRAIENKNTNVLGEIFNAMACISLGAACAVLGGLVLPLSTGLVVELTTGAICGAMIYLRSYLFDFLLGKDSQNKFLKFFINLFWLLGSVLLAAIMTGQNCLALGASMLLGSVLISAAPLALGALIICFSIVFFPASSQEQVDAEEKLGTLFPRLSRA